MSLELSYFVSGRRLTRFARGLPVLVRTVLFTHRFSPSLLFFSFGINSG